MAFRPKRWKVFAADAEQDGGHAATEPSRDTTASYDASQALALAGI